MFNLLSHQFTGYMIELQNGVGCQRIGKAGILQVVTTGAVRPNNTEICLVSLVLFNHFSN